MTTEELQETTSAPMIPSAAVAGAMQKKRAKAAAPAEARVRTCRECGCTEARACPGGCYWIERDLCSACEGEVM